MDIENLKELLRNEIGSYFEPVGDELECQCLSAITDLQDRAIAAESERDELKAKLSEYKTDLFYAEKDIDALKQTPSAPAQRINEQELREIVRSFEDFADEDDSAYYNNNWFSYMAWEGNKLLDKLNEHREPVGAANNKPVGHQWRKRLYVGMYQGEQMHEWSIWEAVQPPYMDAMQLVVSDPENYQIRPVFAEPVTANKAEVPVKAIKFVLETLEFECNQAEEIKAWLDSLPALKDGE